MKIRKLSDNEKLGVILGGCVFGAICFGWLGALLAGVIISLCIEFGIIKHKI